MAATGVVMAFADSYLDASEYRARRVAPPAGAEPQSLTALTAMVDARNPGTPVNRIGFDSDPRHAYEFYHDKEGLDYVDPFTGDIRPSDSVPLRRSLHKGVEQWHRFFGFTGEHRQTARLFASWFNVALIPLFLTGLALWWPGSLRWPAIRAALTPAGGGRGRGTQRKWHTALGFWTLPFLLVMVVTATTHSFEWVRGAAYRTSNSTPPKPGSPDQMWPRTLRPRPIPAGASALSPDDLRAIADREMPGWTRLDLYPATPKPQASQTAPARLVAKAPGWGPKFFPVTMQVDPHTGASLDTHSWEDLSPGTRLLAWSRWLHKGDAFGRTGQIVAGFACLVMLALIYTGWTLAIRRLSRRRKSAQAIAGGHSPNRECE
jgi:uncharacterized iron-regulated membrane protein